MSAKKREIIEKIDVFKDFNAIGLYCKQETIELPIMPLREIPSFLEQRLSISQMEHLLTFILKQRTERIHPKTNNSRKHLNSPNARHFKSFIALYLFESLYFALIFLMISLNLTSILFIHSSILIVSSIPAIIVLMLISSIFPYTSKDFSVKLRGLALTKVLFYLFLWLLTSMYLIIFSPRGYSSVFWEGIYLYALFWLGFSFVYEIHYIWKQVARGGISVEYISKLVLFLFSMHFVLFALGSFSVGYNFSNSIPLEQMWDSYLIFLNSLILLVGVFGDFPGYKEIQTSQNPTVLNTLLQSRFLSFKYRIVVVIFGDFLIGFCVFLIF